MTEEIKLEIKCIALTGGVKFFADEKEITEDLFDKIHALRDEIRSLKLKESLK